ncbi:hypothetical protein BKD09_41900 [Bradyrhizobium japonicum]|uniref:Uncharacterized protein n=1 Tax=Bradyrhizobium japonicum TaxID=375 RepID=A0A1L3FNY7_BRAJP|nr:hypothetical protein BKD09_41900 [Bradyrhizobium japonicum]
MGVHICWGRLGGGNNAAERALRGIALGRRNWTFAGSLRGADRAALMLTMITTCRLNDVDPRAWLADVLARIADLPLDRTPPRLDITGESAETLKQRPADAFEEDSLPNAEAR